MSVEQLVRPTDGAIAPASNTREDGTHERRRCGRGVKGGKAGV